MIIIQKKTKKLLKPKKIIKKKVDENNIFLSFRGLDLQTDFNQILPSINSIIEAKNDKNSKNKKFNKKKTFENKTIKKQLTINKDKSHKESKISQLFHSLNDKSIKYEYPKHKIENYFKKNPLGNYLN